jgi:hypothetical protein
MARSLPPSRLALPFSLVFPILVLGMPEAIFNIFLLTRQAILHLMCPVSLNSLIKEDTC